MPPIVKLGGCAGGVSSSAIVTLAARCAPSFAQRGRDSESVNVSASSGAWSSRIGISTSRGEASPPAKVTVLRDLPEVASRCGRAGAGGDGDAGLALRPARAGDEHEHRDAGRLVGDVRRRAELQPAGLARTRPRGSGPPAAPSRPARGTAACRAARRPLVFTSAGVSFCGSWMNASTADSRPRPSIASASRLTWTANSSPSRTDLSGTFSVTLCASSATACDPVPRSSTSSSMEKSPSSHSGRRESADVAASIVQRPSWPSMYATPPTEKKSPPADSA